MSTPGASRIPVLLLVAGLTAVPTSAQESFLGVRIEPARNRLLLVVPEAMLGQDFLNFITLATGAGVNELGLDRGQTGTAAVARLELRGNRVVLVRDNWSVRAQEGDAAQARSVAESFPTSVVASFPVEEEDEETFLVDATSLHGRCLRRDRARAQRRPGHLACRPRP